MSILAFFSGCGPTVVTMEDVILRPERTRLTAHVEREPLYAIRRALGGMTVTFRAGDKTLGVVKADLRGNARLDVTTLEIPFGLREIEASVKNNGKTICASGRIFDWRDDRVIIALDIDETICDVDYEEVIFEPRDRESKPIRGSLEAVNSLANDFHIYYFSARPRFILEKTRLWIEDNGFPPGPVRGGPRVRDVIRQGALKRGILKEVQEYLPNLLIGIGDKSADVTAYEGRVLPLIYKPNGGNYTKGVYVFRDWKSLTDFFLVNKPVLIDPTRLRGVIAGEIKLIEPAAQETPVPTSSPGTSTDSTSRGSSLNKPPP